MNTHKVVPVPGIRKFKCIKCNNPAISYTSAPSSEQSETELCNMCKEVAGVKPDLPVIIIDGSSGSVPGKPPIPPMAGRRGQSPKQKNNIFERKPNNDEESKNTLPDMAEERSGSFANFRKYIFSSSSKTYERQSQQEPVSPRTRTRPTSLDLQTPGKQSKQEPLFSLQSETKFPTWPKSPSTNSQMARKQSPTHRADTNTPSRRLRPNTQKPANTQISTDKPPGSPRTQTLSDRSPTLL